MTEPDRANLILRDPDTDSEPWPVYAPDKRRRSLVVLAVIVVVGAGLWWWTR